MVPGNGWPGGGPERGFTNNRAAARLKMNDSQILSAFQELPDAQARRVRAPVLLFDACQVGVVLRAVLFVEVVMAVGAMFGGMGPGDWMARVAVLSAAALPGTLSWLLVACSLKRGLAV